MSVQDFGYNALRADLWKFSLLETMLIHEEAEHVAWSNIFRWIVNIVVVADQLAKRCNQIGKGVILVCSTSIQQGIQRCHGCFVLGR